METNPANHHRAGFTLIELLAVIGIIALLASLLLPNLARVKSSALTAKCKSNLRQVGMALNLYVADHEVYPFELSKPDSPSYGLDRWQWLLQPYIEPRLPFERQNTSVCECPSKEGTSFRSGDTVLTVVSTGYGFNAFGYFQNPEEVLLGLAGTGSRTELFGGTLRPTRESEIVMPSHMIAVGDGACNGPENTVLGIETGQLIRSDVAGWGGDLQPVIQRAQKRHHGRANMAFCDGHVEGFTLKALFLDSSEEALSRWNKDNRPHHRETRFGK